MSHRHGSRRDFLMTVAAAAAAGLIAHPVAAQDPEDPFTGLSAELLRNARTNGLIMIHRPAPRALSPRADIVKGNEPGERLVVSGQVFAPDGRTPAAGVTIYAYNTDADGYYGENRAEYPPRIYGWMKTDAGGRFELHTIRPGRYPGMHVPAHIHFVAWGGGYPLQGGQELNFAGDSYLTPAMQTEDEARGIFRHIQPLAREADGAWHCRYNMKLQSTTTFR
jgi:protocatechuate 3,4-dioxygenase beta subunit